MSELKLSFVHELKEEFDDEEDRQDEIEFWEECVSDMVLPGRYEDLTFDVIWELYDGKLIVKAGGIIKTKDGNWFDQHTGWFIKGWYEDDRLYEAADEIGSNCFALRGDSIHGGDYQTVQEFVDAFSAATGLKVGSIEENN